MRRLAEEVTVFRTSGAELISARGIAAGMTMITPGYMFSALSGSFRNAGARAWYRGRVEEVSGDDLVTLEPGEVHRTIDQAIRVDANLVFVEPSTANHYLEVELPARARRPIRQLARHAVATPSVRASFARLCRSIASPDSDAIERESALREFLRRAFASANDSSFTTIRTTCDRTVRTAREMIADSYNSPLTLGELAVACGASVFQLERSFSKSVGVPIHRYLLIVRIERAMEMLRAGSPCADVAIACGFADQPHMIRTFRRYLGLSPGEYARTFNRRRGRGARIDR